MKFIFISLAVLHGLVLTTVSTQQIKVRSHGDKQINTQKQELKERTYEAVLGLNVSPRNRLRVRTRNPKDATDTLAAAEAAGIKAKEIRQKNRLSYRDLDSFETSLIPVRTCNIFYIFFYFIRAASESECCLNQIFNVLYSEYILIRGATGVVRAPKIRPL